MQLGYCCSPLELLEPLEHTDAKPHRAPMSSVVRSMGRGVMSISHTSALHSQFQYQRLVTFRSRGSRGDLSEDPEAATGGVPAPRTDSAFAPPAAYFPAHPMLVGSSSDDDDDML